MPGQWFMGRDGQQFGPYTWEEMRAYAWQGLIAPDDVVWAPHLPGWFPAKRIQDLLPPDGVIQQPVPPGQP